MGLGGLIDSVGSVLMSYEKASGYSKTNSYVSSKGLIVSVGSMLMLEKVPRTLRVARRVSYSEANQMCL